MRSRDVSFFLALATLLVATGSAVAGGSPISGSREAQLPHVCNGPGKPQPCTDDSQCPSGLCEIKYVRGPDATFEAEVTLIIDDDVSKFDGSEKISDVKAATVLLEIIDNGETHLLAQTYQNLEGRNFNALVKALTAGPFLADMESPVSNFRRAAEFRLFESRTDDPVPSILDDFLFQEGDSEMADAVRALVGVTGRPIIADVPEDAALVQRSDHVDDGLASLVRMKVKIRFVPQLRNGGNE
jgi:hypothetical protein